MLGQDKIKILLRKLIDQNELPRSILLQGPLGCGKHTLVKYVSELISLPIIDITDSLNLETIEQIILSPVANIYIIDASKISIREQNMILKLLEEPLNNTYLFVFCINRINLLPTVINRCYCLHFEDYTHEQLTNFIDPSLTNKDLIIKYADTPGRVLQLSNEPLQDIIDLGEKIFLQIHKANFSNVLTIPNKISFKKDSKGFSFECFTYILMHLALDLYKENKINFDIYKLTTKFYDDCNIFNINQQHLFENWLIQLKILCERD